VRVGTRLHGVERCHYLAPGVIEQLSPSVRLGLGFWLGAPSAPACRLRVWLAAVAFAFGLRLLAAVAFAFGLCLLAAVAFAFGLRIGLPSAVIRPSRNVSATAVMAASKVGWTCHPDASQREAERRRAHPASRSSRRRRPTATSIQVSARHEKPKIPGLDDSAKPSMTM
jgi:hypothetical protein